MLGILHIPIMMGDQMGKNMEHETKIGTACRGVTVMT